MNRVAIIGGGLTGLSTAYYLAREQPNVDIHIYEQADHCGGKIQTKRVDGFVVELGPDSYLGRKTEMTDLIRNLGLGDTIVANATGQAYVYDQGATHPIPGGSIMGVPTEMMPFVKATLISWPGKIRAALDLFKSPYKLDEHGDVSIGHFFQYHLGQEMMDKLIEPLLAGIYGGDIYKISLLSTFPHFIQVEQKHGNMVKGMIAAKGAHKKAGVSVAAKGPSANVGDVPQAGKGIKTDKEFQSRKGTAAQDGMFRQLTGGLASVIDAIVEQMPRNVTIHNNVLIENIQQQADFSYELQLKHRNSDGVFTGSDVAVEHQDVQFDTVIISTPPASYRQWFRDDAGFDGLRDMEQSTCAIAIMTFDKATFDGDLHGSGLLITRKTKTPLTACTNLSQKWPQTTPDDKVVLRVFIGKPGDTTVESSSDEELAILATREIQRIMGFHSEPIWVEVNRLVHCMPQYNVGHRAMVKAVRAHVLENYPNLYLIGTPFDGIGIPDGVKQAKELVQLLHNEQEKL